MYFFINNTNNKPCLLAVHRNPIGLPLAVSVRNLLDFHWPCPLEVCQKSPLDFVVWPKMPRQAVDNHWKNTGVKQQKKINSGYPKSNGLHLESAQKSNGSVKTLKMWIHMCRMSAYSTIACV